MVADIWVGAIADAILVGRAADIADGDKRLKRPPPTGGSLFTGPLGIGPKKSSMSEARIAPRKRVLKSGTIDLGAGGTIACAVKNLSETGAALEVITPLFIPDRFKLIIETEHINRPCQIAWRKEKRMGITFI